MQAVVAGNTAFAVDLYGSLKTNAGNLFFSPSSISTALAMTYAGARGKTAEEMAKTLHFTLPQSSLPPASQHWSQS
jgi:serpin B